MGTIMSTQLHVAREYNKIVEYLEFLFSCDYNQLNCFLSFLSFSENGSLQLNEDVEKKQKWNWWIS